MSKIVPGKTIRNMLHIFCLAIIITAALSLGSASGTDGFIDRITGTTTAKAATSPVVTTNAASNTTATSATLNSNLTLPGTATQVNVSFEYGTSTTYGFTVAGEPPTLDDAGTFTADLTGLTSGQTYHFRAKAVGDGTAYGGDQSFTTLSTTPAVDTGTASNITFTGAKVSGSLTGTGTAGSVTVFFEYGTTTSYGSTKAGVPPTLDSAGDFTADLTGLNQGQTYHFRAKAVGDGTALGVDESFTTLSTTPAVDTGTASNITNTGAKVNGSLTDKGTAASVTVSFEYGTTPTYGSTAAGVPPTLNSAGAFIANLTGLTPGQTYHFRTKAVGNGTVYGSDESFTTLSTAPAVDTGTASNITNTGAKVSGSLTGTGTAGSVTVSFEYGTTTSYGSTKAGVPPTLDSAGDFTADLTGLNQGQTYHFRAKAVGNGTVYGKDATFTALLSASFTFTKFDITPSTSHIGDTVNITVTCTNIGGSPGTYPVVLKINGVSEQTEEVNLDPGKSQEVTFDITESEAGTYEVNVNELTSSFVVQKSNAPWWPLVGGIAGGTIVVGLIILFILIRHSTKSYNKKVWE